MGHEEECEDYNCEAEGDSGVILSSMALAWNAIKASTRVERVEKEGISIPLHAAMEAGCVVPEKYYANQLQNPLMSLRHDQQISTDGRLMGASFYSKAWLDWQSWVVVAFLPKVYRAMKIAAK